MQARDPQFDTKLLIYRTRQIALAFLIIVAVGVTAMLIREGIENDNSWFVMGAPICGGLLLFVLFPATEHWEYKAWQSQSQKIEQQSSGK